MRHAIYYTDGRDLNMVKFTLKNNEKFLNHVTIIVITQVELSDIDPRYIVINSSVKKERSHHSLFNQILEGLLAINNMGFDYNTDVTFLEHDVLYPHNYFEDIIANNIKTDSYYSNNNMITLRKNLGWCDSKNFNNDSLFIHVLSQMTFNLGFAIKYFITLLQKLNNNIPYSIEPHYDQNHEFYGKVTTFKSQYPCVNITDGNNFTNYTDIAFEKETYSHHHYWGSFKLYTY